VGKKDGNPLVSSILKKAERKIPLKMKNNGTFFLTFLDLNKIERPTAFSMRIVAHTLLGPVVQLTKS
jgi:hypothetical protein